jgi:uncharacterized protein
VGRILFAAVVLAVVVPAIAFLVLRRRVELLDAAAIAATYGSVSAVTFIAASNYLTRQGTPFSDAMAVALVVMESPAIIMAVALAAYVRMRYGTTAAAAVLVGGSGHGQVHGSGHDAQGDEGPQGPGHPASHETAGVPPQGGLGLRHILREAFTDGAHLLLIGSLAIGALVTDEGAAAMEPFTTELFTGVLAFFLLEMGLLVCREIRQLRNIGAFLIGYGLCMPLFSAGVAIGLALTLGMDAGNAVLLAVLGGSASYIVVPAVLRYAIPEARPSRYFGLALGVTFPFNILLGIPIYHEVVTRLW